MIINNHPHLAKAVLMIRPSDFTFNAETAQDNEFQHRPKQTADEVNQAALAEFDAAVAKLQAEGINVIAFDGGKNTATPKPDAVFPNNWFATRYDGTVVVYKMLAENRKVEVEALDPICQLLKKEGFEISRIRRIDMQPDYGVLEGTGSLIFDHTFRIVYAAISARTDEVSVKKWAKELDYERIIFKSVSSKGMPFYHTNVVLSIGNGFAVICSQSIKDPVERKKILDKLSETRDVIEVSFEQTEQSFCANLLQVSNADGAAITVMSSTAYRAFLPEQLSIIERYSKVVPIDIHTIEEVGGGSARCMLAEVFLQKAK